MLRAQAVTNIGIAEFEVDVLADKVLVDLAVCDDVVGNVVQDRQIGLRLESQLDVGQLVRAVLERGEHGDLDACSAQTPVGHARPKHRVHFRHVGTPEHESVGGLNVVIAAHGLVHAEGAHEAGHGRCHAVACVRVDVVGAETGLEQFGGRVAFPYRPLA